MPSRWASGRVDVEGLPGRALLRLAAHVAQRAHVVQPVGELDHQHPDVARHRHDHLADGLGLRGVAVLDLVELGDPVDERPDLLAEVDRQLVEGVRRVLDRVVEQRGHQRRLGHPDVREDRGDRERVGDVGIPALAHLGAVHLLGGDVGPLQQRQVGLRVVGPHGVEQRLEHRVAGLALGAHPRQPGAHAPSTRRDLGRALADGLRRQLLRTLLGALLRHLTSLGRPTRTSAGSRCRPRRGRAAHGPCDGLRRSAAR